ncbi:MAG: hypothetical protein NDI67_09535 [Sulfuritalea sp.]|nr:hypothetical protein [Sulfuritalea sp.]
MKRTIVIGFLAVSSAYLLAGTAAADTSVRTSTSTQTSTSGPPRQALISGFSEFAGSEENAASLVNGLRSGSLVTLAPATTGSSTTTVAGISFMPPTRPMGWGNVRHALTLAQRDLAAQGITDPTPAELQAALTGGSITTATGDTVNLSGTLALRSQGMGWGQISKTIGEPLGNAASIKASGTASGTSSGTTSGAVTASGHRVGAVTTASGAVLRPASSNGGNRVQARIDGTGMKSARSGSDHVLPASASASATSGLGLRAAGNFGGSGHSNNGNGGQGRGR